MKLKLSKEWLRRKFREEEQCLEIEAGIPPWSKDFPRFINKARKANKTKTK